MKDELKKKLEAEFERRNKQQETIRQRALEAKKEAEEFILKFMDLRDNVIAPAMREIGEFIKEKGFNYRIDVEDEKLPTAADQTHKYPSITFYYFKGDRMSAPKDTLHVSFSCVKSSNKVRIFQSNMTAGGGVSGPKGDLSISKINADLVQNYIGDLIAGKIF
ncbi:MAG: hypothetical protein J0I31_03145 [Rhizobiales bacterium]|nr:hypothetical protein [Hyphomicrobiales bacterium]